MSKTWYPVINYEICIECGACVNKCRNGVYDKSKYPYPVVVNGDGCVQGCHGCGNLCPASAIKYAGDVGEKDDSECCCNCDDGGCC